MKIIGDGGHASVVREIAEICGISGGHFIAIGNNQDRKREALSLEGEEFPTIVHPRAYVSPTAVVGPGSIVMPGAIVNTHAVVGAHCIVNSLAVLEHDSVMGDFGHLAPGAIVCGGVRLGEGVMIGANGAVLQYTHVPAWYRVKANNLFHYNKLNSEESFWARTEKTATCWIWMGAKNHNGYGIVSRRSGNSLAHRVAWTLTRGPIPDGLYACHKCDTPACINPDHLFLGTQSENMRDMTSKGRSRKGRKFPKAVAA